jgi:predicted HAD superfamily Cof-like phosphohydrolase
MELCKEQWGDCASAFGSPHECALDKTPEHHNPRNVHVCGCGNHSKVSISNYDRVLLFHDAFGHPVGSEPTLVDDDVQELRYSLIQEELDEYRYAIEHEDIVGIADALTDLLYVTYGALICHGMPADDLFEEVHRSNMTKLGEDGKPIYREDGKVLKGPNFELPNLHRILYGEDDES